MSGENNPYDPNSMPGGEVKNLNRDIDNDKVSGTIDERENWKPSEQLAEIRAEDADPETLSYGIGPGGSEDKP
jgi:hypothetical protein